MNILYLTPYVPSYKSYHAGGVNNKKQYDLLKEKHNVYLMTFIDNDKEEKLSKEYSEDEAYFEHTNIFQWIKRIICHPFTPNFFAIRKSRKFEKKIEQIVKEKKIDAIHSSYTSMGQFVKIKKKFPNIKFSITEEDVTQQSYRRTYESSKFIKKIYYLWQLICVKRKEKQYLRAADYIFVMNSKDKKLIQEYYQMADKTDVLIPYYGVEIISDEISVREYEKNSLCFVGQMGREENKEAALRLIKIFNKLNVADKKLYIIGANPDEELKSYSSDQIIITGFVDDINAYISKCKIAVFPLMRGAGIKLKVLLAFALGLPVITSLIGAEGIDESGNVLMLASSDEEYIKNIEELLKNNEKYDKIVADGNKFVKEHFDWSINSLVFDRTYN